MRLVSGNRGDMYLQTLYYMLMYSLSTEHYTISVDKLLSWPTFTLATVVGIGLDPLLKIYLHNIILLQNRNLFTTMIT